MKTSLKIIVLGFVAGLGGAFFFFHFWIKPQLQTEQTTLVANTNWQDGSQTLKDLPSVQFSNQTNTTSLAPVDFSEAAAKAIPSVVYINSISQGVVSSWDWFFGGSNTTQKQVSSGSGVIFSTDGYIVTNNHVIESAEKIEVIYNKRVYPAELVGTDPSTDLAVLKIEEKNLPAVVLGNAQNVQVGEWVIAVGNPFSLSSTVTAGIVSAKGRRIGILEDKFPIESFIQTDAAINPGNSGGALVNKSGELVGINTAILSRTGSYTGYAFAVPVDIAKKVVGDLIKYGIVQKALAGGNVIDYDYQTAKKYDLPTDVKQFSGVVIEKMEREGPLADAGLKPGDIITKWNELTINSKSNFEEWMAYQYPGDKVTLTYMRDSKVNTSVVTLVNKNGLPDLIKRRIITSSAVGAQLEANEYGVKVFKIKPKSTFDQIGLPENFTIIAINRQRVKDPEEVIEFFEKYKGDGYVYGINSNKQQVELRFRLR
ncbi:MAG: trypsin-like peptidase domain-containing protein [Cyclobacteriaceae bacterium]|nr:trypsin-like peptidase domain-containing protein [Cytophagales bacterium]MCZ8328278.1 trypsin-like peptidase domain-containing protein [Cyclobacteriaceae bacterium]